MHRWYCLQCAILVLEFARALSQQIPTCNNNACCQNLSYTELDNSRRSVRSQWKSGQTPLCDRDHVTVSGWYRFTSFVGEKMPISKVNISRCGTHNPIWLDGTTGALPTNDTDSVTKIKACINVRELRGGCYYRFTVGVKLCPGKFFVYYLQKILSCYAAYCAGDGQPCPYGQTGTSLSTCSDVVPQKFPSLYLGYPNISVKDEPENENVSLLCTVPIHGNVSDWKNVTYEIEWYTDGNRSKFTEKPFCKPPNDQNENSLPCPNGTEIRSLLNGTGTLNYYKPGQRITCKVKARFTNNLLHPWSDTKTIQQPFFAGINVTPTTLLISECTDPLFHSITLTPTIPVRKNSLEKFLSVRFYLPNGLWLVNKEKCSVQLEGTNSVTVKVGATCTTLHGSQKSNIITPVITNRLQSKFWGNFASGFGLPTIWVTVLQKDQPLHKCLSVTDPHIRPLHKVSSSPPPWRHFFGHEEYLLYRNKEKHFEVQTKQWACNSQWRQGITCNCGVVIRDHNDLISFSCCGNPPKVYRDDFTPIRVDIPRKKCLAPGITMTQLIKGVNSKYEVIVPTGIKVIVERNYWGIDVTIYTPQTNQSQHVAGLCTYSGNDVYITHLAWKYRLTASSSYFQTLPTEINKHARPVEPSCACSKTQDRTLTTECVNDGIPVASFIVQSSKPVNRIMMCDNNIHPKQNRKRRDIEGSDELTHDDFEVLMTPFKSNKHHREKRSVVSKDNATRYCAERLLETRVGKLCAKLGTNVQALVNVCSADIEYTGDFSFAIGAVSMLMNECEDVVIENMTVNSNETNVTKPTIPSALENVLQLLCPNDCTFNGKCVNGSCVCNKDYTAADCSISIYQRPTITRIQSNGLCDRRKRPCEKTTVQGRDFLNSTNMTCHIREIEIVNSSWIPNKNETKYQGTMTDLVLVECLLPSLPVLRMRYHETIKGTPAAGLMISVSNNGIDKSSQELKMISFDSVCMDCNVSAGCRLQKNACFINRYCFAPNEPSPRDWCQQCIPEVNTNSWTKRQVNHPPNVALETNYYVVYRENFKLPIEAVDPEGMPVTVSLQEGSPKKAIIRNNVLYWNVATNQTTQFSFKATDACQASSTFNMTITVVPCPCKNSGQCVPQEPRGQGNYTCQCAPGYTREYCGTEIDECASYPCLRGRCTDLLNNYSCSCDFGFEGRNCDLDIDYCKSSPCVNAGNCTDEVSGYTCNCLPGYSGSRCEVDINECSSSPCLNNGTCVDQVNSFKCSCSAGYTGHNCSVNIDECQSSPCVNNGSCIDGINGFGCTCKAGFAGLQCEEDVDECLQVSCGNGTCFDRINNFSCVCDVGYMGRHCDVVITRCSNDSCYPGVPCMDKTVPISCGPCPSGFTGNGKNCKDIDDCDNHTCANGASCVDGINRYSCLCTTGFIGRYCEIDIDDCINNTCANGASCVDGINSYSCNCRAGFTGANCNKDIDECASGPCFNGGSCVDGVNRYLCNCSRGFTGKRCGTNIDDCFNVTCEHGATCVDGISNYTCSCQAGYTGTLCQTDVDDCVNHTCINGGSCVDGVNSYSCSCVNGYSGDRCEKEVSTTTPTPKERSSSRRTSSKATSNPTTEAEVSGKRKTVFSLEIRLLEDWDNSLGDKMSRKFKDLATMMKQQILRAYSGSSELKDVEIISMRPGSIIVDFKLTFKTEVITRDALAPLKRVMTTGNLGRLHVDPTSLREVKTVKTVTVPPTEDKPVHTLPLIIGLSCGGAVLIAVVAIIACYCYKTSTPPSGQARNEVGDAMPADETCSSREKYELTEVASKGENPSCFEEKGILNQGME